MKLVLLGSIAAAIIGIIAGMALHQGANAMVWAYAFGGTALVLLMHREMGKRFVYVSAADARRLMDFYRALHQQN